ncbi:MAG: glycosyltransferase [Gemmatimonadales bacterium]|nr:glycosyltransferase [Gemmatimonadales bacterium]
MTVAVARRRVLLLTERFPPSDAVGAQRPARLARALAARGHAVRVLCISEGAADRKPVDIDADVRRIPVWQSPSGLTAGVRRAFAWVRHRGRGFEALPPLPVGRYDFWAAMAAHALPSLGWADVLYSTSPSEGTHAAALLLHRLARTPWVAEFRDPWVGNLGIRGVFEPLERWLQDGTVRRAARLVTVTEALATHLRRVVPGADPARIVAVPSGIDVVQQGRSAPADGPLQLVFAGVLYPPRDLRPIFDSLGRLRGRAPAFHLHLVGNCDRYGSVDMRAHLQAIGLADVTTFHGWLARDRTRALLEGAHLNLLAQQGIPLQVAQKTYDYLGARVPMLALADREGDTARLLARVGGHHLLPPDVTDPAAIDAVVAAALEAARDPRPVGDLDALRALEATGLMAGLARVVEQAAEGVPALAAPTPAPGGDVA